MVNKTNLENGIYKLTISRPEVLNALSSDVLHALDERLEELKKAKDLRAIIITGEGQKSFVAGADIAAMKGLNVDQAAVFAQKGQDVFSKIENMEVPVIAAVNGFALGGGFELALACDYIFASDTAKFGLPEVGLGLIPGFGGTQRLSRNLGLSYSKYLITTGAMITSQELFGRGLIIEVTKLEDLQKRVFETAKTITMKGRLAIKAAKNSIQQGFNLDLEQALLIEKKQFSELFASKESEEGICAFLEKRAPKFN